MSVLGVAVLFVTGCDFLGKRLGKRSIDLPLGDAGSFEAPDSVAVHEGTVRIDSVRLPERLYITRKLTMDPDDVELEPAEGGASPEGTGIVECGMLIDGYPVAVWTVEVQDGEVTGVDPETTPVPGKQKEGERTQGVVPLPSEQFDKMSALFAALPEQQRPPLADDLGFTFPEGGVEEGDWRDTFRGVNGAIEGREFQVTIVAGTEGTVRGTLALEVLNITVFDSGQRLIGGTETAE